MKGLIAKTVCLFLVVGILLCYQVKANSRAALIAAHDSEQSEADALQKEYDKQVAETKAAYEGTSTTADLKYKDGTYQGASMGFGGDITVEVTVENDKITALEVLDHSGEDDAYYNTAVAVVDTILANGSVDGVDTVSGATFSSTGIIGAVNDALSTAEYTDEEKAELKAESAAKNESSSESTASVYKDGTYQGASMGFGGDITVEVTVENDKITALEVLDHSGEDDAYYNTAVAVVDTILANGSVDGVDTVSGATFSSTGIIGAVNDALEEAKN